jgi:6-pyruvoyltetrahydropterin/6-carboxytetrahydropterin synthase
MKTYVCKACGYVNIGDSPPEKCPKCGVGADKFLIDEVAGGNGKVSNKTRSFSTLGIEYAHRFLGYAGEAEYLHGHHGQLTIEVEGGVNEGSGFVHPCNSIKKAAWEYLQNFDHALILQENDPLLPVVLKTYEEQGIRNGTLNNTTKGSAFDIPLAKAYPECRLVVVKKVATCENLIELFYSLLKDKMNIKKLTFTSGANGASQEY